MFSGHYGCHYLYQVDYGQWYENLPNRRSEFSVFLMTLKRLKTSHHSDDLKYVFHYKIRDFCQILVLMIEKRGFCGYKDPYIFISEIRETCAGKMDEFYLL